MNQVKFFHVNRSTLNLLIAAFAVSLIGGLIRFYFVFRVDFPLNDGGLFHAMIEDLLANNYVLPWFTSYNSANIPYAYSPLSFYLAGLLHNWIGWSLVDILRILPALLSTLSIPVFFFLAIEILNSREQAILATIAYALLLPAFEWLVMGGGLTRSLATLFSLASLHQASLASKSKNYRSSALSGVFLGLSALSHQEIAMVTFVTIVLFFVFINQIKRGWQRLAIIFGIAGLVTVPFIITVSSKHGVTPFISAFQAGEFEPYRIITKFLSLTYTGEIYYTPFMVIAFLGIWGCFAEKKYLLPSWLAVMTIINPRSIERTAMIPVSLLIGYGLGQVILPALGKLAKSTKTTLVSTLNISDVSKSDKTFRQEHGIGIALLVVLFFQTGTLLLISNHENVRLASVPIHERAAMTWVEQNTPANGSFLVLSSSEDWASDKTAEWFPVLSQRVSVNTAQGLEWLPDGKFSKVQQETEELKECLFGGVDCIEDWSERNMKQFTHIYLSKSESEIQCGRPCKLPIENSLLNSPQYSLIFENESAAVLEKIY